MVVALGTGLGAGSLGLRSGFVQASLTVRMAFSIQHGCLFCYRCGFVLIFFFDFGVGGSCPQARTPNAWGRFLLLDAGLCSCQQQNTPEGRFSGLIFVSC